MSSRVIVPLLALYALARSSRGGSRTPEGGGGPRLQGKRPSVAAPGGAVQGRSALGGLTEGDVAGLRVTGGIAGAMLGGIETIATKAGALGGAGTVAPAALTFGGAVTLAWLGVAAALLVFGVLLSGHQQGLAWRRQRFNRVMRPWPWVLNRYDERWMVALGAPECERFRVEGALEDFAHGYESLAEGGWDAWRLSGREGELRAYARKARALTRVTLERATWHGDCYARAHPSFADGRPAGGGSGWVWGDEFARTPLVDAGTVSEAEQLADVAALTAGERAAAQTLGTMLAVNWAFTDDPTFSPGVHPALYVNATLGTLFGFPWDEPRLMVNWEDPAQANAWRELGAGGAWCLGTRLMLPVTQEGHEAWNVGRAPPGCNWWALDCGALAGFPPVAAGERGFVP